MSINTQELDQVKDIDPELRKLLNQHAKACAAVEADGSSYAHMPDWAHSVMEIKRYIESAIQEARQDAFDRGQKSGFGIDKMLEGGEYFTNREDLINFICVWKWTKTFDEVKNAPNIRMMAQLTEMLKVIDHYASLTNPDTKEPKK